MKNFLHLIVNLVCWSAFLFGQSESGTFETPYQVKASTLLSQNLLAGPGFDVAETVELDGQDQIYILNTDYGQYRVSNRDMLRIRIAETQALRAMYAYGNDQVFEDEVENTVRDPIEAGKDILDDPGETLVDIPKGMGRSIKRLGNMFRRSRGKLEDGYGKELLGQGRKKRQLATQFNVNPYTSNPALKKKLNRMSWSSWSADALVSGTMDHVLENNLGEDGYALYDFLKTTRHFNEIMAETTPEDLLSYNRKRLKAMGVDKKTRNKFTRHEWYSPLHTTLTIDALEHLESRDIHLFLRHGMQAQSETDAYVVQRTAELMAVIAQEEPIKRLAKAGDCILLEADSEKYILPLYMDHVLFTEANLDLVEKANQEAMIANPDWVFEVRISGKASTLFREQIISRGIVLVEEAFGPQENDL